MPDTTRLDALHELAHRIRTLNDALVEIAAVLRKPAQVGHAGEFIASIIFDIDLHGSAAHKDHDGHFNARSPLAGKTVNIKWGTRDEGGMDLSRTAVFDHLLVLLGPRATAAVVASNHRPWLISSVYLFDPSEVIRALSASGVGVGVASSVRRYRWDAAMVYPQANNPRLPLTDEQRSLLTLFAPLPLTAEPA